jgi:hypothetical protein
MPSRPYIRRYRANLNSASFDSLVRMGKLDPKRAKALVQHRPYRSWDEIEQVPGFDRHVAYSLQESSYLGPSVAASLPRNPGVTAVQSDNAGSPHQVSKNGHLNLGATNSQT